ncbi:zf-HC2 domain-containing protein [Paenibacillus protaetiae]|uniref:Anti-sigma-W factor RsiW n=1 Tax=Paenibacillus protaetiae TaxID=2509456 RepID=A0A4P6EVP4_9BACL|nr:zf-HC2 domain-containing protein [Paenibacillus protaetiae]QAY67370.1 zf-HC2 domain-containing protein [Paenibacillus protaetiae]
MSGTERDGLYEAHVDPARMADYVADRLTETERDAVERHLAACEGCLMQYGEAVEAAALDAASGSAASANANAELHIGRGAAGAGEEARSGGAAGANAELHIRRGAAGAGEEARRGGAALPDMAAMARRVVRQLEREAGLAAQQRAAAAAKPAAPAARGGKRSTGAARRKPRRRSAWWQLPAVQYSAAAVVTLLLVGAGLMSGFSSRLASIDRQSAQKLTEQTPIAPSGSSLSSQLMDRTVSWLDGIEAARFNKR